jgi:hypothetical protein
MTDVAKGVRPLPLAHSPRKATGLIVLVALGIPTVAVVGILAYAYAHGAPAMPLWLSGAFVLAVSLAATLWIVRMIQAIAVTLDADTLNVMSGVASRRFALSSLRANGMRTVNLAEHVELRPFLRTWGIGAPGLAAGWFRLRNRGKALCIVTGRERVTVLKSEDGTWILLSLADASALRDALGSG